MKLVKIPMLVAFVLLSPTSIADSVSIPYAGFYERLKQVNKHNYQLVEIAFSVPKNDNCKMLSGNITTEKDEFPLTYDKHQRLYLPFDAQLKSDRGLLNIEVEGDSSLCGVAMQVRAKSTQQEYVQAELMAVKDDMDALLDGQQGFPMKYFRKPITGLTFSFSDSDLPVIATIDGKAQSISNQLQLTSEQLANLKALSFNAMPFVVSPYVI
ncbi:DUF2987 domain-containing protein [Shewanella sp. 10N.7]|uniref:DUF2987 domain-containing protein n=1 Tax=Shewanella electrodiphila TaxID=934143 RepID=A0ABT0KSQ4_9GAMM|nr:MULTISPECIES: DUF2987 domain-containing protein [Shewanella]MCC4831852.1 DUF2987 domain-containing protein [Shewanella sp. 10N.7]MCL1046885.1 DUF2987 domain-containing protein [Shewanella electrodiphila]